jgi:hypothetical protein
MFIARPVPPRGLRTSGLWQLLSRGQATKAKVDAAAFGGGE